MDTPRSSRRYNSTEHPLFPGIYRPEGDCTRTALGYFLSAGDNFSQCVPDPSDPYSTTRVGAIQQQIALDWARSNDVDPTSGSSTSVYTIPKLVRTQVLSGHAASLTTYQSDTPRPSPMFVTAAVSVSLRFLCPGPLRAAAPLSPTRAPTC